MLRQLLFQNKRRLITVVSFLLLLSIGTGAVLAYIATQTPPLENTLEPGSVSCSVNETFDGTVKSDVSIQNTGNTAAFIRAAVVINWQSKGENTQILAKAPLAGTDYTIAYSDSGWVQGSDGFWYCETSVLAGESTPNLIQSVSPVGDPPAGYSLCVEIVATAIQAQPISTVQTAWGVTVTENRIVPQ